MMKVIIFTCSMSMLTNTHISMISLMTIIPLLTLNMVPQTSLALKMNDIFAWDFISVTLMILSSWIFLLSSMSNMSHPSTKNKLLLLKMTSILLVIMFLVVTFKSTLSFYMMFELSLPPMIFMILGWGYQPERIQAGMYMLMYTITASLPLLILIITTTINSPSSNMFFMNQNIFSNTTSVLTMSFLLLAFMVKLPMFITHLWLPKAHVEAPVSGSMILAGILLKMGGYGIIRFTPMIQNSLEKMNWFWISLSLLGGSIISILCTLQTDLKSLIAYTSVSHMSLVLAATLTNTSWGTAGSLILMIGHGLSSSGLFCAANIMYTRSSSRSMFINKSTLTFMPSFSLFWFLLCASNMAAPPSLNLLGEIILILSLTSFSIIMVIPLAIMSFSAAVYSLYLFIMTQHGKTSPFSSLNSPMSLMENWLLANHLIPMFSLILTFPIYSL